MAQVIDYRYQLGALIPAISDALANGHCSNEAQKQMCLESSEGSNVDAENDK